MNDINMKNIENSEDEDDVEAVEQVSTLDTTYDAMAFALLLAERQEKRPDAKRSTIFDLVIGDPQEKYGIVTNGDQCRDNKKKLDGLFRSKKENYSQVP